MAEPSERHKKNANRKIFQRVKRGRAPKSAVAPLSLTLPETKHRQSAIAPLLVAVAPAVLETKLKKSLN